LGVGSGERNVEHHNRENRFAQDGTSENTRKEGRGVVGDEGERRAERTISSFTRQAKVHVESAFIKYHHSQEGAPASACSFQHDNDELTQTLQYNHCEEAATYAAGFQRQEPGYLGQVTCD